MFRGRFLIANKCLPLLLLRCCSAGSFREQKIIIINSLRKKTLKGMIVMRNTMQTAAKKHVQLK